MTWSHFIFLPAVWFSLHIFGQKRATSRSPRRNLDNSVCKTMEWEAKPKLCLNSQQLHNKVWFRQHTKASHTQGDAFLFFLSSRRRAFSYANMLCFDDRFDVGSEKWDVVFVSVPSKVKKVSFWMLMYAVQSVLFYFLVVNWMGLLLLDPHSQIRVLWYDVNETSLGWWKRKYNKIKRVSCKKREERSLNLANNDQTIHDQKSWEDSFTITGSLHTSLKIIRSTLSSSLLSR